MTLESDYEAMITVKARRDRLDKTITEMAADSEFTPVARKLGMPARRVDADRVRVSGRDR